MSINGASGINGSGPALNNTQNPPIDETLNKSVNRQQSKGKERIAETDGGNDGDIRGRRVSSAGADIDWAYIGWVALAVLLVVVGGATTIQALAAKKIAVICYASLAPKFLAYGKLTAVIGTVTALAGGYLGYITVSDDSKG